MEDLTMPGSTYFFIWLGWVAILVYALYERYQYKEAARIAMDKVKALEASRTHPAERQVMSYAIYSFAYDAYLDHIDSQGNVVITHNPRWGVWFLTMDTAQAWLDVSGLDKNTYVICRFHQSLIMQN